MLPILPAAPSRTDPANFSAEADAWVAALPAWTDAVNAIEGSLQASTLIGTSTTNLSVGTGSKGFSTQAGKAWLVGSYLFIVATSDNTKVMQGKVSSYNSSTGSLVVDINLASGSGTYSSWNIGIANPSIGATSGINVAGEVITSGNVGVGGSPFTWDSGFRSFEIGSSGFITSWVSGTSSTSSGDNAYYNSSVWKRKIAGSASMLNQNAGAVEVYTATNSSSGSNISWVFSAVFDSSSNLLMRAGGGIGYGPGSGASVTQATSKTTGVTLNKPSGQITMNAAALASNTSVTFLVSNTSVLGNDNVIVNLKGGYATYGTYDVKAEGIAAGSFVITLKNISGGSLSEAVILGFSIIRGSTT